MKRKASAGAVAVPSEIAEAMAKGDAALMRSLRDLDAWVEELSRVGADALPWPLAPAEGLGGLLVWFAQSAVATMLEALGKAHHADPDRNPSPPPEDERSADFQIVLRFCKRAVDAAEVEMRPYWQGTGRVEGWTPFLNELKRRRIEQIMSQTGANVTEAAKAAGISPSAAYRQIKPKRR